MTQRYQSSEFGLYELRLDMRQAGEKYHRKSMPNTTPGELWTDTKFSLTDAIKDPKGDTIEWKRPGEFLQSHCLFADGATRMDVGQGTPGTCYFLAMAAIISEKEELLKKVIHAESYSIGTEHYQGVFSCNFWRYGEWDPVYIDDFLPVVYGQSIWGAHSASNSNELWVALLEKAFAKYNSSYDAAFGGYPDEAYLYLAGGVSEKVNLEDCRPTVLFSRLRNALKCGSLVACCVPGENEDKFGLIGNHAYSVTGFSDVKMSGKSVDLLRVRNPWGETEWTGPWSDRSSEWERLPPNSIKHANINDGEFWVQIHDFVEYFRDVTICSLSPDFDKDGCTDSLNHVLCIFGDWVGDTAAGWKPRLNNPRYELTITEEGIDEEGTMPVVLQIIQKVDVQKRDKIRIRCDIYKVLGETETDTGLVSVVELRGQETNMYNAKLQICFRHRLEPGHYIIVPSAVDAGLEKEFLIRLFTPSPVANIQEIGREHTMMSCDKEEIQPIANLDCNLKLCQTLFGAWRSGVNAGGQRSHATYHINPQICFVIPADGNPKVIKVHLLQESGEQLKQFPLGIRIYPMSRDESLPVDQNWLRRNTESCMPNKDGKTYEFMFTNDLDVIYVLPPGRYLAVLHLNTPEQERNFAFVLRTAFEIDVKHYNMR
ncbi:hypothetical protein ScPMuIL_011879 [Solemya velum]